jgi:general secretion pathway protein D
MFGTTKAANTPVNLPETATGGGFIIGGAVTSSGNSVVLELTLQGTPPVKVFAGQGQTIDVDVLPSNGQASAVPGAVSATPAPIYGGEGIIHQIVRLKYADLSEVVGLLVPGQNIPSNDTFAPQPGAGNFGSPLGGGVASFGGGPTFNQNALGFNQGVAQHINDNVSIDRRLNAVILTGPPDLIASYKAFIDEIDIPLTSVMLETQIVELTDNAAIDAGIDFTNGGGPLATASLSLHTNSQLLASSQGQVSVQAAVYAQITKGNGRLIAQPRILALDGTQASIITGDALPIVTSIAVSGVNAVQQQVQYVNVGVNLQIQPRVSSDGYVTVHVYSAVSSVTGFSQTYPQISQRQAYTSAIVKDGESFVIGGLLEKSEINQLSKIPGIGDLPLIGFLFRVRNNTASTDNLYIIVTPHILVRGK